MIAVDTNVLCRIVTKDEQSQLERAAAVMRRQKIFVSLTVLLETEWVLRGGYNLDRDTVNVALANICGLSNVHVERPDVVAFALEAHRQRMDFADALHLAVAAEAGATAFACFDRDLAKRAARLGGFLPITEL